MLCVLMLLSLSIPVQSSETKVLVIESYHKEFYWDAGYRAGISQTLGNRAAITFFEMDTKRIPKAEFIISANAAIAKIDELHPDIIMLGDDNALTLVGGAVLNRKIPFVFLGINGNPRDYFNRKVVANMTGILERPLLKRSLMFVRGINPDWKEVLVLFDDSNTSRIYRDSDFFFSGSNKKKILGLNVEIFLSNSYESLQAKVQQAQTDKQVIFLGGLNALRDKHDQYINTDTAISWIYQQSAIPMFSFWRGTVGKDKSIGGYVIDGFSMGVQAAKQVIDIIDEKKSGKLNIKWLSKGHLVLSTAALKRWNIEIPKYLSSTAEYID